MSPSREVLLTSSDEMERVWGFEWGGLSIRESLLIVFDFMSASCSAEEYRRRIGEGNLQAYVACLKGGRE